VERYARDFNELVRIKVRWLAARQQPEERCSEAHENKARANPSAARRRTRQRPGRFRQSAYAAFVARAVAVRTSAHATWAERASDWLASRPYALYLFLAPLVPLVFLGYGTDIDTWNVRTSAASIRAGDYVISRPPGAPVHEAATAVLDWVGGSVATNLASLAAAAATVYLLPSLLRRAGAKHAELATLALVANPFFIVSATSLVDELWAIAFLLGGIEAAQRRRPWWAGTLWALAIGCRMSTVLLVIAYLAAETIIRRSVTRATVVSGAVSIVLGCALFVPAWLSVGRSAVFLENTFGSPTFIGLFGRWVVKQGLFIGLPAVVVLAIGWRSLADALRRWRSSTLIAFAVIGGVLQEALFFRLPWKFTHLLPVLVCVVIVFALVPRTRPEWFVALAVSQLVWGFLALRTVVPDVRDQATRVRFDFTVVAGPLVSDVRCRMDDPGATAPRPTPDQEYAHALALYRCTNSWAYGSDVDVPSSP
jgi:hypothetical protein